MQAARPQLRKIGFIGLLLMVLGLLAPPALAAPCGPPADPPAIASAVDALFAAADPCPDDCEDCGLACAHGCCHVHAGALIGGASPALPGLRFDAAAPWAHVLAPPGDGRTGPERPPRA